MVINGGNEEATGSTQLWIRCGGKDITPPISFLHPEILAGGEDRAEMSCQAIAQLDGGTQLITANMASAMFMLVALMQIAPIILNEFNNADLADPIVWTELQFNLPKGTTFATDNRSRRGWQED